MLQKYLRDGGTMIEKIVIHCSDSPWGSATEIRKWHLQKGWKDIGYHFVIGNGNIKPDFHLKSMNGNIEVGRELDGDSMLDGNEIGAHALGYNKNSIGICLIGKESFSHRQMPSLLWLTAELIKKHSLKVDDVIGHYETESGRKQGKTCPNIDVEKRVRKHLRELGVK